MTRRAATPAAGRLVRPAALGLWAASLLLTTWLSLTPRLELPVDFFQADKVCHFLAYLWLGGLPALAFRTRRAALSAAVAMIPLGLALDAAQAFVPGRMPSLGDALANGLGALAGAAAGRRFGPRPASSSGS